LTAAAAVAAGRASDRYSWKLSRRHCVKVCGSGISSRQDVGDTTMRPSYRVTAKTRPMPSEIGRIAEK
jgi:hypothetical protein